MSAERFSVREPALGPTRQDQIASSSTVYRARLWNLGAGAVGYSSERCFPMVQPQLHLIPFRI
jgi:hypothetical protein